MEIARKKLKDQFIKDLEHEFGNIFKEKNFFEKTKKYLNTMRESHRRNLIHNPKYKHPPFIVVRERNEFILDAKEKGDAQRGITLANVRRYAIVLTTSTLM